MSVALPNRWSLKSLLPWVGLAVCLVLLAASFVLHDALFHGRALQASPTHPAATAAAAAAPVTTVTLSEGKWNVAGIRIEPVSQISLPSEVGVAGKVEANPDRRVEIRPRAAGVVREVLVNLGRQVKKGELLAVLDSPDVGTARLNLRGRQIELATARKEFDWKQQVANNVARLIPAIRKGEPAATIQKDYAERPLGADRALLLQAYSEFEIASHESEKTSALLKDQIIGEHPAFVALHTFEGAQAKLGAVLEQVRFDASHEQTLADQKVRLAEAAVIDAAQRLRILGVQEEISQLLAHAGDVAASRSASSEDVTACQVTAPFDGTIITKTAVPSQKADPTDILFVLADLNTVWVMANITESDLAVLPALKEGRIRMTVPAYPGRTFPATLLSVGSMVDPTTRTVPLLAETDNPDGLLKLEMFTRIVLDTPITQDVLTVSTAAIVEIEGQEGVFVPAGRDGRTFTFQPVKLGREADQRRVVLAGLTKGQAVVSAGAYLLKSELILQNESGED
ncbi:membrane fusion protein, cobalt-zinc-cadmium efflux system [Singulisphaera sp. GP187]|uniref:efflux RND transporter periplasmic adaptor subunit n=1 Tax=Singulisphaera sp. GP187 TaxID=1882752 RepID=UPI00092BBE0A|nr:efflux RND transporter periplasmic adaptor subunit [Singulisphaera sp. GP187]SIO29573.1 membrane fusion protein, cobalt-zinc-cadmium efflux system [Singulisphaera sp. GP187]